MLREALQHSHQQALKSWVSREHGVVFKSFTVVAVAVVVVVVPVAVDTVVAAPCRAPRGAGVADRWAAALCLWGRGELGLLHGHVPLPRWMLSPEVDAAPDRLMVISSSPEWQQATYLAH